MKVKDIKIDYIINSINDLKNKHFKPGDIIIFKKIKLEYIGKDDNNKNIFEPAPAINTRSIYTYYKMQDKDI